MTFRSLPGFPSSAHPRLFFPHSPASSLSSFTLHPSLILPPVFFLQSPDSGLLPPVSRLRSNFPLSLRIPQKKFGSSAFSGKTSAAFRLSLLQQAPLCTRLLDGVGRDPSPNTLARFSATFSRLSAQVQPGFIPFRFLVFSMFFHSLIDHASLDADALPVPQFAEEPKKFGGGVCAVPSCF